MPARELTQSFSDENGQALHAQNNADRPGGFTGVNYVVEVKHIFTDKSNDRRVLRTKDFSSFEI